MKYGLLVLAALCSLSACSKSTPQSPGPGSSKPTAVAPAAAAGTLESLGFKPELASERSVTELSGDFNGDGVKDHLLVVKSASLPKEVPASFTVTRPWPLEKDESEGDLSHGAAVNLVIVDGKTSRVTVLHDDNSVSLLDAPAAAELKIIPHAEIASLQEAALAKAATGDVLAIPTEAGIDTYIYWDGSAYKLLAPADEP